MMTKELISCLKKEWFHGYCLSKIFSAFPHAKELSKSLSAVLNHDFKSEILPVVALTHSSALVKWQKDKSGIQSNEKLEFLGDSLLNFYVSMTSAIFCPKWSEAELSRARARLVSTENLSKKARALCLENLLIFGSEETKIQCVNSLSVMADAYEAICACLLLDAGLDKTFTWLNSQFNDDFIQEGKLDSSSLDVKSNVQSWLQRVTPVIPEYKYFPCQINKENFLCEVRVFGHCLGVASGSSKQKASVAVASKLWNTIVDGHITHSDILMMKQQQKGLNCE